MSIDKYLKKGSNSNSVTDAITPKYQVKAPTKTDLGLLKPKNVPSNKSNTTLDGKAKECPNFCREPGFSILPLRYGVSSETKKSLPKNLGENVTNISLKKHKYITAMIKEGYIYLYFKRGGKDEWKGYITNNKGYHNEFQIVDNKAPPLTANNFACQKSGHPAKASLIVVPEKKPNEIKAVYIIHTHAPLTKAKRQEFAKNADAFVTKGYWQKIDISKWRAGSFTQKHCFSTSELIQVHNITENFGAAKWKDITNLFVQKPKEYCAISLYDAIGITRTLNDSRNLKGFGGVNEFLNKKKNGFSNNHRMQTMAIIENLEKTVSDGYIAVKSKQFIQRNEDITAHSALDLRRKNALEAAKKRNDIAEIKRLKLQIDDQNSRREINKQQGFDQISKEGFEKGAAAFKKYAKQLDMQALDDFKIEVNKVSKKAFDHASLFESDHLSWLQSKNLLNGIFYFDKNESFKDAKQRKESNGFIFHTVVMDLMYGMTFLDNGQQIMDEWINEKKVSDTNLYLRAYCFNNNDLMENYDNTFSDNTLGKTTIWYTKKIFTAFKAADEAFDKWLDSIDGKKFILSKEFKAPDKMFYWMSNALNSILRKFSEIQTKTISVGSITMAAERAKGSHAVHLFYLRSGELAKNVPLANLFYNLEFTKGAEAAVLENKAYSQAYVLGVGKDVELTVKSQPKITQNRILAIVGVIELLNFYFQYGAWQKDSLNKPEVAAALSGAFFALSSVSLRLLGENAAALSLTEKTASHLKISAASFGVLAGVAGLFIELNAMKKANSNSLFLIFGFRFLASLGIVIGQIGNLLVSMSSAFSLMQKQAVSRVVTKFTAHVIVAWLMTARVIAGLNVFTIALIVLEQVLRIWVLDDAMEDWCQKSAFRLSNKSKETPFKNEAEEQEAFVQALVKVI